MSMSSGFYQLARAMRWGEVIGKALGGNAKPLAKRIRNKYIMKGVGRFLR